MNGECHMALLPVNGLNILQVWTKPFSEKVTKKNSG